MNKPQTKKIVPVLRFPEFKDDGEWEETALQEVGEIITGSTPSTSEPKYYGGDKMFVSPADISDERYIYSTKTTLSEEGFSKTRHIKENSILFVCIGSTIGKVAQNKFECATNQQINSIIPYEEYTNDLIYSILENDSSKIASIAGNQAVPIINKTLFSSVLVNIPPTPEEQQKIADCLSSLDELLEAHTQKLGTLKRHKKVLLQQLFPAEGKTLPQLRFPEFKDAGEWEEEKLGDIGDVLMCKRIFSYETNDKQGIPFFKIGTLGSKPDAFINRELFIEYKEKYNFPRKGEVLITCSGTVGKCFIYDGEDAYYQDSNIVWIDNPKLKVSNNFLYYYLDNYNWSKLNSTTITRIYGADLRGITIVFPDDELEQQKIIDSLTTVDELITAQSEKIEALKAHKKGLMQQLFPNTIN